MGTMKNLQLASCMRPFYNLCFAHFFLFHLDALFHARRNLLLGRPNAFDLLLFHFPVNDRGDGVLTLDDRLDDFENLVAIRKEVAECKCILQEIGTMTDARPTSP